MLSHSQLPPSYWSYAVSTVVHIINRLPTPLLKNLTLWELLFKSKPDITHLRSFGCVCFPLLKPYNSHKLQPHTTPCIFLGYPAHTKGYICQNPQNSRIYISRHVHFNELEFFTPQSLTTGPPTTSSIQSSTQYPVIFPVAIQPHTSVFTPSQPSPTHSIPTPILASSSQSSLPNAPDQSHSSPVTISSTSPPHPIPVPIPITGSQVHTAIPIANSQAPATVNAHPMVTRSKDGIYKPKALHTTSTTPHAIAKCTQPSTKQCSQSTRSGSSPKPNYTTTEPSTYKIVAQPPQWCSAMDDEFHALQRQGTWILVPPSPSQNLVGCKWVYKLKHSSDGSISRYKARLVAKGFHQQFGVDFEETFSPVIKPPTVRIILSLAIQFNWPLR